MTRSITRFCSFSFRGFDFVRCGLALATLLVAGQAEARPETLRFTQSEAERVSSYRVLVGSASGRSDLLDRALMEIGTPDASGIYSVTVEVDSQSTVYIRMMAVGSDTSLSTPSNEIQRRAPLGMPGQPMIVVP
jgi:hypothetical protein